jgi:hypothetical protein
MQIGDALEDIETVLRGNNASLNGGSPSDKRSRHLN